MLSTAAGGTDGRHCRALELVFCPQSGPLPSNVLQRTVNVSAIYSPFLKVKFEWVVLEYVMFTLDTLNSTEYVVDFGLYSPRCSGSIQPLIHTNEVVSFCR